LRGWEMLYNIAQVEGPCWGEWDVLELLSILVMLLAVFVGVVGSVVALVRRGFHAPTRPIPPPWVFVCGAVVMCSGIARDLRWSEECSAPGGHWLGISLGIPFAAWLAVANMRLLQSPAGAILWVFGGIAVLVMVANL
jgi:hypothetical protein